MVGHHMLDCVSLNRWHEARNAARKLAKGLAGPGNKSRILMQDVPAPEPNIAGNIQADCRSERQCAR